MTRVVVSQRQRDWLGALSCMEMKPASSKP
jgi:hypothetical protein